MPAEAANAAAAPAVGGLVALPAEQLQALAPLVHQKQQENELFVVLRQAQVRLCAVHC